MSDGPPAAGVIGSPIRHSLSPLIHGLWLKASGIEGFYATYEILPAAFAQAVADLRASGLRGLNVTVPHKEAAFALAERADRAARAAGAANLLLFNDRGVEARNTDGIGLLAALAEQAPRWKPCEACVTIIGAGGAAKGALAALDLAGAGELRIVNRSLDRAEALAEAVSGTAYGWDDLPDALEDATLVINATTRGLNSEDPLRLPWPDAPTGAAALDMVYRPLRTAFLEDAHAAGWTTVDGLAMLIGQARPSFTAFFGRPPPADTDVRAACLKAMEPSA